MIISRLSLTGLLGGFSYFHKAQMRFTSTLGHLVFDYWMAFLLEKTCTIKDQNIPKKNLK